jgi:hypothetical protein
VGRFVDDCTNEIRIGDRVFVVFLDPGRGAVLAVTGAPCEVVGFGRSRLVVQHDARNGTDTIGPECVRVVEAVDGRRLLKPSDLRGTAADPLVGI